MANKKLTDLTELTTPADNDFLYIVDVSDTTESAQGTSKKIRKDKVDSGASKENIANKQNDLTADGTGTKYPTVDAVNAEMVKLSGNQTISGTKTYSDKITIKGSNVASSNIQTGSMYMSDTGSVRSNFTIDADATSPEGANIRLQVSSPNSHIGINKAGTLNSALALLWDNTNTGASIDLRGTAFLTNSATMQFTRLSQLNNDFIIKNFVAGNTILDNTKVGINTDAPLSALQVNTSGQGFIRIGGSDGRTIESFTNAGVSSNTNVTNLSTTTIYSTNIIDRTSNQLAINFGANFIAFKTANTEKARLAVSGALLLNKTTDDGIVGNKLQVNGNITASAATLSNQVVVKSQLDAIRPYKVYTALLSQTGTNAPTAIVLENTLGGTIVWTRDSAGIYYGTLSGAFSSNKTVCFISGTVLNVHFNCYQNSTSSVTATSTNTSGEGVDTAILGASIEIRVYN